jgi:predicted nuclease of predicted toxin-antitoxin system
MTFWLDAHLDPQLAAWLGSRFRIGAKPLREIDLRDAKDEVLLAAAKRFGEIVILTKDEAFVEMVRRAGPPPQMVWLRCGNLSTPEIQVWLGTLFQGALDRLNAGETVVELNL